MNAIVKPEAGTEVSPAVTHKNVFAALAAAQMEFGTVTKGAVNPAFKSRYADLADVAAVVIPTLASHGVAVLHYIVGDAHDRMRTEFVHGDSETRVNCDVPLLVDRNNMQGMKSATTYAKRIGLESLSGVAPEDDDGNAAVVAAPKQEPLREPVRQEPQRQQQPGAVDIACDSFANADTLDRLAAIWGDLPRSVQGEQRVIAAKDAAKSRLSRMATDLGGDEIPY